MKSGDIIKLKYRGVKSKFRILKPQETITENCLCTLPLVHEIPMCYEETLHAFENVIDKNAILFSTNSVGETVSDWHTKRVYLEQIDNFKL